MSHGGGTGKHNSEANLLHSAQDMPTLRESFLFTSAEALDKSFSPTFTISNHRNGSEGEGGMAGIE